MPAPALVQQSSKTSISIDSIVLSICFAVGRLGGQLSTRIGSWLINSSRQSRTTFVLVDLCRILGIVSRLGPLGRTSLVLHCRLKGQRRGRREALSYWGESRLRGKGYTYLSHNLSYSSVPCLTGIPLTYGPLPSRVPGGRPLCAVSYIQPFLRSRCSNTAETARD